MKTYEGLEAALAVIESPEKWCQANRMEGDRRCALGAFDDVLFNHRDRRTFAPLKATMQRAERQLAALAEARMGTRYGDQQGGAERSIAAFNDTHTHGEVVALFKTAIRAAKECEAQPLRFLPTPWQEAYLVAPDKPVAHHPTCTSAPVAWHEFVWGQVPIPSTVDYKQHQLTPA